MANFNFNKVILGGRLTADPELKTTGTGASVTSFTIAVNRRFGGKNGEENPTDFINCTAWTQPAEFITRFFRKGSCICVVGSIQTRSWTDNSGAKRYATDVVVDEANFVDSKNEGPAITNSASNSQAYVPDSYGAPAFTSTGASEAPKLEVITDDDDLPF